MVILPRMINTRLVEDTGGRDWIVDGGATAHHTGNRSLLTNIRKLDTTRYTRTGNGRSAYNEVGDAVIVYKQNKIQSSNVVYVPGFDGNLVSVPKLTDNGCTVVYDETHADVMKDGRLLLRAQRTNGLYTIPAPSVVHLTNNSKKDTNTNSTTTHTTPHTDINIKTNTASVTPTTTPTQQQQLTDEQKRDLQLLHERLGHVSYSKLADIIIHNSVSNIPINVMNVKQLRKKILLMQQCECVGCVKGKMSRLPLTGVVDYHTSGSLDLWTVDTMGPFREESLCGGRHVLVVVDVHTRYLYTKIIKQKSDAPRHIISLIT